VRYEGREVELMDTAGIRRNGKIEVGIERFSVIRALSAIESADVCMLLMDVNELNVQLDQKIAGMVKDAGKGAHPGRQQVGRRRRQGRLHTRRPGAPDRPQLRLRTVGTTDLHQLGDRPERHQDI